MSFRGRLALFFLLIVVIPIAAIALLVADVTDESQAGKADARLSTALAAALAVYEEDTAEAKAQVAELLTDAPVLNALRSGGAGSIERAARAAGRERGLELLRIATPEGAELEAISADEEIAVATVRTTLESGTYEISASVTGPTEYVEEVGRLTGLDVALAGAAGATAATNTIGDTELPAAGDAGDVSLGGGETLRAAAGALPESDSDRIVVFTERESGGFFDSRPRLVAAVAVFLALALASTFLLVRALQGQIAAMLAAARRIGSGDFSQRVPVVGRDEMAGLATEFNQMSDRLEAQIAQLRRQRTELDRSVRRLGEAFASGLDRGALLAIVAETALGACDAGYCRITLDDGGLIELPEGLPGSVREAAVAAGKRSARDAALVAARREKAHALAAPLRRLGIDDHLAGTMAIARAGEPFDERDRDVFLYLIGQASASIGNISAHERVSEQAVTDELTGLANNRSFRETIDREAARAERFDHELSLIILDLDDFKQVNDTHGHLQGDEVLRTVGRILDSEPRAIDESARYGGEEFVVALPETGNAGAVELAERIRARLEAEPIPAVAGGKPLHVTASFGTATMPGSATTVHELFAAADQALYEAKRAGKNRVVTAPGVVRSRR